MATDLQQAPKPLARSKYEAYVEEQFRRAHQRIRLLDLAAGGLGLAGITLGYALFAALLDRWLDLPSLARQLSFCTYLIAAALFVGLVVLRPLFFRLNPYFAARQIEASLPGTKNSVVNWLDLHTRELPPAVQLAIGHRAAKDLAKADLDQAIRSKRTTWLGAAALGLFLGIAILFLLGPRQFFSLMNRAFAPFGGSSAIATRTQINIVRPEGGDTVVPVGRAVNLAVYVGGKVPEPNRSDALRLHLRYGENDPWQERALERGESARDWGITIAAQHVQNGFSYKITGGDATTPEHRVQVRSSPLLTGFDVTYRYRAYLGWKQETTHDPNLRAIRGTEVELVARTNRSVLSGQLSREGEPAIPAERVAEDALALRFKLVLEKDASYRIWFTSQEGERNADPMAYTIRVTQDAPPHVEVLKPGDTTLASNGVLTVEGHAHDDFGITGMALQMQVKDGPRLRAKPYRPGTAIVQADGRPPRKLEYRDFAALDQLLQENGQPFAPQPGTQLKYWLEAADNCDHPGPNVGRSEEFTIQIEPPSSEKDKQQKEREQNSQEQKRHEANQDRQLQQPPPQDMQDPPNGENPPEKQPADGNPSDVQKQAEQLKRAIEKTEQEKQGQEQQKPGGEQNKQGQEQQKPGSEQNKQGQEQQKPGGEQNKQGQEQQKPGGEQNKQGQEQQKAGGEQNKQGQEQQKPGGEQNKQGQEQQKPGGEQNKQGQEQQKPGGEQNKQGQEQQKPGGEQNKQGQEQQKPGGDQNKQGQEQQKPGGEQNKQGQEQQKPGGEQNKQGQEQQKPGGEQNKQGQEQQKPGGEQNKQGQEQQKPGGEQNKQGQEQQKPGGEQNKQGQEQQKPGGEQNKQDQEQQKPGGEQNKQGPEQQKPGGEQNKQGQEQQKPGGEQNKQGQEQQKPGGEQNMQGQEQQKPGGEQNKQGQEQQKPGGEQNKQGQEQQKHGGEQNKQGQEQQKPGGEQNKQGQEQQKPGGEQNKQGQEQQKPGGEQNKQRQEPQKPGGEQNKQGQEQQKPGGEQNKQGQEQQKPGGEQNKQEQGPQKPGGELNKQGQEQQKPGGEQNKQGQGPQKPGGELNKQGQEQQKPGGGEPATGKGQPSKQQANQPGTEDRKSESRSKETAKSKDSKPAQTGSPSGASNPGKSGNAGREGATQPGTNEATPPDARANDNQQEGAPKSANTGDKADDANRRRAGDLQLDDFKKRVNKDVLKKANMTEAEYEKFLKAYEALLRNKGTSSPEKEILAGPQRGGGDLSNQNARQVMPGATDKAGPLQRTGPALPPPEFRDAARDFSRKLSELQRATEKK